MNYDEIKEGLQDFIDVDSVCTPEREKAIVAAFSWLQQFNSPYFNPKEGNQIFKLNIDFKEGYLKLQELGVLAYLPISCFEYFILQRMENEFFIDQFTFDMESHVATEGFYTYSG